MLLYQKLKEGSTPRKLFFLPGGNRVAASSMAAMSVKANGALNSFHCDDKLYVRKRKPARILHGDSNKTSFGNRAVIPSAG
jgi:hypothetical protein